MYLKPFVALRLAISLVVCGGSHMIFGVDLWHDFVLSCCYLVKWLWQRTSGWESTCYYLFWCRQGMHYAGSMCGTMIHFSVVMWQLVFIGFFFHVLLIFICSWEAFFGEWDMRWRCPLGVWFSLLFMFYVSGGAMGKPWLPHHISFLSHGVSHLKNLGALRRHFMAEFFDGVAWAIIGGNISSAQRHKQPHTYHK